MANSIVSYFIVILTVSTGNMLKVKKARIMTPIGSDTQGNQNPQNYLPWPVPFFTDNLYGPPIIPPIPTVTTNPGQPLPPATIGRVDTINPSIAPVVTSSQSPVITPLAPVEHIFNPSLLINYSDPSINIVTDNSVVSKQPAQPVPPLVTIIDSKYIMSSTVGPIPQTTTQSTPPISLSATQSVPNSVAAVESSTKSSTLPNVATLGSNTTVQILSTGLTNTSTSLTSPVPKELPATSVLLQISSSTIPPLVIIVDPKYIVNYSPSPIPSSTNLPNSSPSTLPLPTSSTNITNTVLATSNTSTNINSVTTTIIPTVNAAQNLSNSSVNTSTHLTSNSVPITNSTIPTPTTERITSTIANSSSVIQSPTTLLSTTSLPITTTSIRQNLESSTVSVSPTVTTAVNRPLGLDCRSTSFTRVNSSGSGSSFQVELPIKFDVNINSKPDYVISISPTSDNCSDVVEITGVNSTNFVPSQSASVTPSNHIKIDLSDPNLNVGWPTAVPSPAPTPVPQNRISQQKCLEYYSSGRKSTRRSQVTVFIIGGTSSNQKEFPHMAALGYGPKSSNNNNLWLCGASLISELFVVTAGHCLSAKTLGYVSYVRLGTTTLQTETLDSADYNVVRRIAHPNYVEGRQYNDIALLELDRPVAFTEYIAPICLYTSTNLDGGNLQAIGWGKTSEIGTTAKDLQKVNLDYVPNSICQQAYSVVPKEELPNGILEQTQVCAGTADGSRDTCQGDSGGPLEFQQDGRAYLVGITSFGIGCGTPGTPGVYTRVSNYVPWIEQIVWNR